MLFSLQLSYHPNWGLLFFSTRNLERIQKGIVGTIFFFCPFRLSLSFPFFSTLALSPFLNAPRCCQVVLWVPIDGMAVRTKGMVVATPGLLVNATQK